MNYLGISAGFHDAAISLIDNNGKILYAGHSERYNKLKHSNQLTLDIVQDAMSYSNSNNIEVHYYEQPLLKYLRQLRSGENPKFKNLFAKNIIGKELLKTILIEDTIEYISSVHIIKRELE